MLGWALIVLAWGGALAWIADTAASRGRSQIGWTALGVAISIACFAVAMMLLGAIFGSEDIVKTGSIASTMLALLVPLIAMLCSLSGLGLWLRRQPIKIRAPRLWPVSCRINGSGKLEILPGSVRLIWDNRTEDIARADLRQVRPDGECLRLAWTGGELMLMPMASPQTRDGRIEQSQTLARLLGPASPAAAEPPPVSSARP